MIGASRDIFIISRETRGIVIISCSLYVPVKSQFDPCILIL